MSILACEAVVSVGATICTSVNASAQQVRFWQMVVFLSVIFVVLLQLMLFFLTMMLLIGAYNLLSFAIMTAGAIRVPERSD